jgi:hypothetical protein
MRKHIRDLSVRQRGTGLTCNERTRAEEALDTAIMASIAQSDDDSANSELSDIFDESIIEFYQIMYEDKEKIPHPVRNKYYRRIRNIDTDECRLLFRFDQTELIQLAVAWQVPQNITLDNGIEFNGEEAFLIMLARLTSAERYTSMELFWGRDATVLCRAFNTVLR